MPATRLDEAAAGAFRACRALERGAVLVHVVVAMIGLLGLQRLRHRLRHPVVGAPAGAELRRRGGDGRRNVAGLRRRHRPGAGAQRGARRRGNQERHLGPAARHHRRRRDVPACPPGAPGCRHQYVRARRRLPQPAHWRQPACRRSSAQLVGVIGPRRAGHGHGRGRLRQRDQLREAVRDPRQVDRAPTDHPGVGSDRHASSGYVQNGNNARPG